MGLLDDIASDLDATAFCDPDLTPGSEAAVYKPHGGSNRTIYGNGLRMSEVDQTTGKLLISIEWEMRNHATLGAALTAIDFDRDRIALPFRIGETAKDWRITWPPMTQDAAMIKVRLT